MVWPTISGKIVERLDHVLMTLFSPFSFISLIFLSRWASAKGPFFSDLPITTPPRREPQLPFPTSDDQAIAWLLLTSACSQRWFAPRCDRAGHTNGRLAFAAAVGMVHRVHGHTAYMGSSPQVPGTSGFADDHVLVLHVAHLADGGTAGLQHHSKLTGRKPDCGVFPFFGHELGSGARGPNPLAALARLQLDVVDDRAHGNVLQRQGVARLDVGPRARFYHIAHVQAHGS